jgi:ABC-type Zn uptake system ZnuABC Zn-binding protein ZnuA
MKRLLVLIVLLLVGIYPASADDHALTVVATTTIVADVARNIGGERVQVMALVPADADTHAFTPSPQDVAMVAEADLLLAVGAGYEAFLGDLIEAAGEKEPVILSLGVEMLPFAEGGHDHEHEGEGDPHAEATPEAGHSEDDHEHEHGSLEPVGILGEEGVCDDVMGHDHEHEGEGEAHAETTPEAGHSEDEHEHGSCDPHVWTDPRSVMMWAENIAAAFSAADPDGAALYSANATAYRGQLIGLDTEIKMIVNAVPEERRVLVTNHEFMGYFAHAYGFEMVGTVIPGGTTEGTPDPQELAALIEVIQDEGVPAIFAEVSANPRLAETIASEAGINVVTALYSESLSGADGPAATYIDYMRYNAQTIADALK